ncbi:TPA: AfaD family invasin [Escherichia coli]
MKKKIQLLFAGLAVMLLPNLSCAAEITLDEQFVIGGDLRNGTKIAKGRIFCPEAHTEFRIWVNSQAQKKGTGHYILLGKHSENNRMNIRLEGDGWRVSSIEAKNILTKFWSGNIATFDVVVDGDQKVPSDEYFISVSGYCISDR